MNPVRFLSIVHGNPDTYTGCEYHRQLIPHIALDKGGYPVEIVQIDTIDRLPVERDGAMLSMDELLQSVDFVHFGRIIDMVNQEEYAKTHWLSDNFYQHKFRVKEIADRIHAAGKPIVLDLDDYWRLSHKHVLKESFRQSGQSNAVAESVRLADHITVTTPFLAERVREENKNCTITILPNAIDRTQPQWQQEPVKDEKDRLRFGWIGGSCHYEDFEIVQQGFSKIWHDDTCKGKYQVILGGFNVSDQTWSYGKLVKIPPERCIYTQFEKCLTDEYRGLRASPNYTEYLKQYSDKGNDLLCKPMSYMRQWAVDTYSYGKKYNLWDVTFIPLNDNVFNNSKSQLKMIESGFMGKAVIVSGVLPYTYDAIHMVNAWVVPPNKNHKGWSKAMRAMIHDRAMVKELAYNLEQEMKAKYSIEVVNEKRWECFCIAAGKKELVNVKKEMAA